jgi:hypothetical protein
VSSPSTGDFSASSWASNPELPAPGLFDPHKLPARFGPSETRRQLTRQNLRLETEVRALAQAAYLQPTGTTHFSLECRSGSGRQPRARDWLAVQAVLCERVSAGRIPCSPGRNREFPQKSQFLSYCRRENLRELSVFAVKFPIRRNREFFQSQQGISGKDQGFEGVQLPLFRALVGIAFDHRLRSVSRAQMRLGSRATRSVTRGMF